MVESRRAASRGSKIVGLRSGVVGISDYDMVVTTMKTYLTKG